ncbi:MAG: Rieske 2Fe-2S domain-containing protein [Acidobacteria bacterium]|nr:Rieske 2Fe-2S domain-containing protein [Acidobacteriota bacterium]
MSTPLIIALAVAAIVVLGGLVFVTAARKSEVRGAGALSRETKKRDRSAAASSSGATGRAYESAATATSTDLAVRDSVELTEWVAPDPEAIGETRRAFFNRATVTLMSASLGAFGASLIGFLWKGSSGGFGSKIAVGKIDDVIQGIKSNKGFMYYPEARAWVTEYPKDSVAKAQAIYGKQAAVFSGMQAGVVALYQKCPHLGCRVPNCASSQWFECGCHGSMYNRVGEKKGGPAPRGMDRFGVAVNNGVLVIDTGAVFGGPPIGTNTTGQEAEGPHCLAAGGGGH